MKDRLLSNPFQSMTATTAEKAGNIFKTLQCFDHRPDLLNLLSADCDVCLADW
jgi:hypothetical protein